MSDFVDLSQAIPFAGENDNFQLFHRLVKKIIFFIIIFFLYLIFGIIILFLVEQKNSIISPLKIQANSAVSINKKTQQFPRQEVVGFLPSWIIDQKATVDPSKLTQLIYFGIGVTEKGDLIKINEEKRAVLEWHYFNSDSFKEIRKKASQSNTKVLVAIKNFDNVSIDTLISSDSATNNFIKQLLSLIKEYQLDGVNLDFEYFTDSNYPTSVYFNKFLTTINKALKKQDPRLIVSIDVNATVVLVDRAYDMAKIGATVDQIILMTYDYHQPSSSVSGPIAPLFAGENEHSIDNSVQSLIGRVPTEKILLGIPFYGYEWETIHERYKSPTVAHSGALATYKRVAQLLENRDDIVQKRDDESSSPWLIYKQSGAIKQIYYEDDISISAKMQYIKDQSLGGVAIWALGYEGEYQDLWNAIFKKE